MLSLQTLFSRFQIRTKLWLGFGLLMLFLTIIALAAINGTMDVKSTVNTVVKVRQPMVIAALELLDALDRSNAALGFYLLSKDQKDKTSYIDSLGSMSVILVNIKKMPAVINDTSSQKVVAQLVKDVALYSNYKDQMLVLATDFNKNFIGIGLSAEKMNPIERSIRQYLGEMALSEMNEEASSERKELLNQISNLRLTWSNLINENRAYMAFRSKPTLQNIALFRDGFNEALKKISVAGDILTFEQVDAIDKINEDLDKFYSAQDKMITLHGSEKWRTDSYLINTELNPLVRKIKANITTLIKNERSKTDTSSLALIEQITATSSLISVLLVVSLIIGIACAMLITHFISQPLRQAVTAMFDIAEGDGDLTSRLQVTGKDEIAELAHEFNVFVEKIQTTISEVTGATTQLASSAEEMAMITNDTRQGATRQQSETDLVATAMNQMTATVQEVARHADTAADAAQQADQQARDGSSTVAKTIESIGSLASEVERAADVINNVERDSEKIGSVLEVIQGIAEQTNLLALNAAIEAARAGEQGRGFAVVADEVRTLASRTQQSTQEIQQMIESLQSGSRNAVDVMSSSRAKAKVTVEQASLAGTALGSITDSVGEINNMNSQIADAARQQGEVAEEINQNIVNIAEVALQTAEGADQLGQASSDLAQLSSNLQLLVNRFKV